MIKVRTQYCPQNHRCPTLRVCPAGALMQRGRAAPTIDRSKCTDCGLCTQSCRVFVESPHAR